MSEEEPLGFCLVDVDLVDPGSQVGGVGVGVVIKQIQIVVSVPLATLVQTS